MYVHLKIKAIPQGKKMCFKFYSFQGILKSPKKRFKSFKF